MGARVHIPKEEAKRMKITARKIRLAWKFRRPLWRYRSLIAHRRGIAGGLAAAGAICAGVLAYRGHRA